MQWETPLLREELFVRETGDRCGKVIYHIYVAVSDTASVSLNPRKSQSTEKYTIKPQKGPVLHNI